VPRKREPRFYPEGRPEIFPGGTAARVLDLELTAEGHSDILLYGEFRFELEREIEGPYRQAVVRPVEEPWLNERDAGIVAVRQGILHLLRSLAEEMGDKLEIDVENLASNGCDFEELINRVATRVELPPVRKLQLLTESLPERGLSVLSILKNRQQVFDLLRPYRRRGTDRDWKKKQTPTHSKKPKKPDRERERPTVQKESSMKRKKPGEINNDHKQKKQR